MRPLFITIEGQSGTFIKVVLRKPGKAPVKQKTQNSNTPLLHHSSFPITIVSDGQTGADRAALDWALAHGVPCGGWCPKGRKAEDGPIDAKYLVKETPSTSYLQRTE
ncbi:MAG: putative molybdenum carrier protein [Chthoniobacterales bacterium]